MNSEDPKIWMLCGSALVLFTGFINKLSLGFKWALVLALVTSIVAGFTSETFKQLLLKTGFVLAGYYLAFSTVSLVGNLSKDGLSSPFGTIIVSLHSGVSMLLPALFFTPPLFIAAVVAMYGWKYYLAKTT